MSEALPAPPLPAPALTARRSPTPFIVIGGAAIIAGIANAWGGYNFPSAAPVEQAQAFGFTVDYIALIILAVIGVIVARQQLAVKPSSVFAIIGMCLTALVFVFVAISWIGGINSLSLAYRLHYSDETWTAFLAAPLWITGIAFCAFAYRQGGTRRNNVFSVIGIALGIAIFALAAFSGVIYGLGLTT